MAAQYYKINYKSDFVLTINSDAGWAVPFCIKFWTGMPSHGYFAGFDGENYVNCLVGETPTQLLVMFDDHHMPIGQLRMQIAYHTTIEEFPDRKFDEVTNPINVTVDIDGTEYQVMLDFTGETAPEIEFNLPAYANEAQRIANEEQRISNEAQRIANEEQRIANEEQRISAESIRIANEESRISEFAQLKHDAEIATADANDAATLANEKAALAAEKAALAAEKAALSQAAAELANAKATLAQQKADYAQTQGDYAKAQGDYAKDQGNIAEADHERAESDHTRAESDHAAVEVYVDSIGAFDISAYHATVGVLAKYVDLSAALDEGNNIPEAIRKGGMSIKFVQSSDNKYVQYFLTKDEWSVSEADWQKLNLEEELTELEGKFINEDTSLTVSPSSVVAFPFYVGVNYYISSNVNAVLSTRYTENGSTVDTIGTVKDEILFTPTHNTQYLRIGGVGGTSANLTIKARGVLVQDYINAKNQQMLTAAEQKQARQNLGLGNGDIDTTPTAESDNLVTSDGVHKELYTEKEVNLSLENNYISEKYIGSTGNLQNGGALYNVYYFPCRKDDKFNIKASINSSVARLYAIYSTADANSINSSSLLSVGPVCNTTEEENVIITQDNAQMLTVQYYSRGTLSVNKIEYASKFNEELIVGKEWAISEVTGYDDNEIPIQYNIVWADGTAGTVVLSNFNDDVLEYQTITATYLDKTIVYNIVFDANGYITNETLNVNSNN